MGKDSFTLNPNGICIFGSMNNPKSKCLFDYWSIYHFYWTGFLFIIIHHFLKIRTLKSSILLGIILTILHFFDDYLGNNYRISSEGLIFDYIGPLIDKKINPKNRQTDNDSLENVIGDVLSGFIACILITIYWYYNKNLPYFYLIFVIMIYLMLKKKAHLLYDKK